MKIEVKVIDQVAPGGGMRKPTEEFLQTVKAVLNEFMWEDEFTKKTLELHKDAVGAFEINVVK